MAKPRKQKLKVFRTPIGFHDAYVAAPSRKAALEAWGADANIFAQGIAEEVDAGSEPAKQALANPGEVVRTLRGSAAEQVRALGKSAGTKKAKKKTPSSRLPPAPRRQPKPSRAELDKAEAALEKHEGRHRAELKTLEEEAQKLRRRRRELERKHADERKALKECIRDEKRKYERAMEKWRG